MHNTETPESHNDLPDPIPQHGNIEIDEQTQPFSAQPEGGKKLRFVEREQCFRRLDLDDKLMINEQIDPQPALQANSIIDDRNDELTLYLGTAPFQLIGETEFIN